MPPSQDSASTNAPNKRKKMSGLTGLELRMAYQSLISVKSFLKTLTATNEVGASDDPQVQENLITFEPDFEETLTKMLHMMESKLDGPQVLAFSGMTEEDLSKLNIAYGGSLKLKTDYKVRVDATEELGKTEHWSSEGLYRHLRVLQKLVPRVNEAASRAWIDSFFFRASQMFHHPWRIHRQHRYQDKHIGHRRFFGQATSEDPPGPRSYAFCFRSQHKQ
ncbi:unnamed protein product [Cyclocybe aegerita]|uniref:Uncharacterized protein n=1 Tax=Cyclocybe aegerita TaxID=1973307 RepID=A0A8S0VQT0_CYCAE|nr:unnamed protein product [Cyclocybe aegerita]